MPREVKLIKISQEEYTEQLSVLENMSDWALVTPKDYAAYLSTLIYGFQFQIIPVEAPGILGVFIPEIFPFTYDGCDDHLKFMVAKKIQTKQEGVFIHEVVGNMNEILEYAGTLAEQIISRHKWRNYSVEFHCSNQYNDTYDW